MGARDPDEELLARVAQGDQQAVRAMVGAKLPRLLSLAARMLGDRSEAEDVAQEAFIRLWKQAPRWQPGAARFDTWLYRVALNLCTDRLRRRREVTVDRLPEQQDPAGGPDAGLDDCESAARTKAAIDALPERQRQAIVLQYYEELSNIEAAAVMEISVEALESLLARARRSLKAQLAEGDNEDGMVSR